MIDGQGLMLVIDMLGKQLAQAANENGQITQENTQLREQLQALGADNTDAG